MPHARLLHSSSLISFTLGLAWLAATVGYAAPHGGQLLLRGDALERHQQAPLLETDVAITVTGLVARTRVQQQFWNPTPHWVEGVYAFPLPERAAVDQMRLIAGDRVIEGRIEERVRAQARYRQARRAGRKASLVEQERPNLFTTSVANLAPNEAVSIEVAYQHELDYRDGGFELRFPLTVGPRYIPGVEHAGGAAGTGVARNTQLVSDALRITPAVARPGGVVKNPVRMRVVLSLGFAVSWVHSPSHEIQIVHASGGQIALELVGPVSGDRDFVLEWRPDPTDQPQAEVFVEPCGEAVCALLLVMPPPGLGPAPDEGLPRETLFVIDTSGSMHGDSIEQARSALLRSLDELRPRDRFNVIRFSDTTVALFPESLPAEPFALDRARRFVAGLEAEGGTEMLPALVRALEDPEPGPGLRQVVFLTDGSVGNEEGLFAAVEQRLGRSRVFTVGIGSAPNSWFMRKAAEVGRGSFTHVGSPDQVAERMDALLAKLRRPVLRDLEVDWGEPDVEVWPAVPPDLYHGEPIVLTARLHRSGGSVLVRGNDGRTDFEVEVDLDLAQDELGIGKIFARRKVVGLLDGMRRGQDPERVREAVVELAVRHRLVTRYTSLIAVDVTPSRPAGAPLTQKAVPSLLPAGWSAKHVPGVLPQGATAGPWLVRAGFSLLLLSFALAAAALRRSAA